MCGIGAILFAGDPPDRLADRLRRMHERLRPRGPDGSGEYRDACAALVHTRLALIDPAGGAQPMRDPDGRFVLVFNGEITNYRELRRLLAPEYRFTTASDTETLLAAYARWGAAWVARVTGLCAFGVGARSARRACAARDALGVKPLVFARRGRELVLASEAKAIVAQAVGRPVADRLAVAELVVVPSLSGVRHSMFQGIEHLGAGEWLAATEHGLERGRWFRYRVGRSDGGGGAPGRDALAADLGAALEAGVERTMRADVPVGAFLSGGLDSTALACLAVRGSQAPLRAFTIRFPDHESMPFDPSSIVISDDAPYVEALARDLPIDLERVVIPRSGIAADLERIAAHNDRIPAWEQELAQHHLARAASANRKVVLVGDAADETHFGYFFLLSADVTAGPLAFMRRFGADLRAGCLSRDILDDVRPLERLAGEYRDLCRDAGFDVEKAWGDPPAPGAAEERMRATTHLVVTQWLGRLLHNGDVHTMAHGVEARVPFADRAVLDVAQRVPPAWGFRDGVEKAVLRAAARPFIPAAIHARRKSALPRDPRLGSLYAAELERVVVEDERELAPFLDVPRVRALCRAREPSDVERAALFNLLALALWRRHHGVA
jgi:asparagine synthase (glutamine-hydrolysing)